MSDQYLIIPSENRTREFEAKLLFACCAVEAGFRAIVGSRHDIHLAIDHLPRAIYVGKDLRASSALMFRILRQLGHRCVAWDEEGLVYYNRQHYWEARVHTAAMQANDALFAWGPDNADVWRSHPAYNGMPIYELGNPRLDLLRPELAALHRPMVERLRAQFGPYILVNSNFGSVNHILPDGDKFALGRLRDKNAIAFHHGVMRHRRALFERFIANLPLLSAAMPDVSIVVRPHPSENPAPWHEAAYNCPNVHVRPDGGVVPWILGSRHLVHNGCTTAIEAAILGRHAIGYQPVESTIYDIPLPNSVSERAIGLADLVDKLSGRTGINSAPSTQAEIGRVLRRHIAALDGALSSDRIVRVLQQLEPPKRRRRGIGALLSWRGRLQATDRRRRKIEARDDATHKNSNAYNAHRFAPLSLAEVQGSINDLSTCLDRFHHVAARHLFSNVFELAPAQ